MYAVIKSAIIPSTSYLHSNVIITTFYSFLSTINFFFQFSFYVTLSKHKKAVDRYRSYIVITFFIFHQFSPPVAIWSKYNSGIGTSLTYMCWSFQVPCYVASYIGIGNSHYISHYMYRSTKRKKGYKLWISMEIITVVKCVLNKTK